MFDYTQLEFLLRDTSVERLVVGFSGGMDSHVLLHALAKCREVVGTGPQIHALHIHHGYSGNADDWEVHCREICDELGVGYSMLHIQVETSGDGWEAAARAARYQAFEQFTSADDLLLLAHHLDDQVETILFRLFRGTGLKGMAGMPVSRKIGQTRLVRPLLDFSRDQLGAYAVRHGLIWIEDESNTDQEFDRNYLRHNLVPVIDSRWPAYGRTISRLAHTARADYQLLQELARLDLAVLTTGRPDVIDLNQLRRLEIHRQRNALLHWIEQQVPASPSHGQLEELLIQLNVERPDAEQLISWSAAEIRVYSQQAYLMRPLPEIDRDFLWNPRTSKSACGRTLSATEVNGHGLRDDGGFLSVRFRKGGERCHPAGRVGSHPLKKLFQELQVPPWERDRVPLIYREDNLVAVAGLFVCEGEIAASGEGGLDLRWQ
jgi:tRNA(Ile)-lysidine synthase